MAYYTCYLEQGHQKVKDELNNWEYIQDERRIILQHATLKQVLALAEVFITCRPKAVMTRSSMSDLCIEEDPNKPNEPIYMFYAKHEVTE